MAHEEPLFGTVKFFIDTGIPEPTRDELRDELLAQGGHSATRVFDATHVITNTLDFEDHHEFDQGKTVQVTVGYFLPVRPRETELTSLQATLGEALCRTPEAARVRAFRGFECAVVRLTCPDTSPKYYSPHPGKIMSGVIATSSDVRHS